MIKALFFDLEGTLLTSEKKIAKSTQIALRKCKEKGIKVFVATARPPLLKKMLNLSADEADLLSDGGLFHSGGCISFGGNKSYTPMSSDVFTKTLEVVAARTDVNLAVQMVDEKHSFLYDLPVDQQNMWGIDEESILPFEFPWEPAIVKLLVFRWDISMKSVYKKVLRKVGKAANLYLTGTGSGIEIVSSKVNKKLAIDNLIAKVSITPEQVAVFGDDYNDLEMLKGYTYSVAMGNSKKEAKECVSYITHSNDEDGIYHALKDYLRLL